MEERTRNTGQASAVTPAHSKQLQFPGAQKKKANTDSTSSALSHTKVIIQMTKGKKNVNFLSEGQYFFFLSMDHRTGNCDQNRLNTQVNCTLMYKLVTALF